MCSRIWVINCELGEGRGAFSVLLVLQQVGFVKLVLKVFLQYRETFPKKLLLQTNPIWSNEKLRLICDCRNDKHNQLFILYFFLCQNNGKWLCAPQWMDENDIDLFGTLQCLDYISSHTSKYHYDIMSASAYFVNR